MQQTGTMAERQSSRAGSPVNPVDFENTKRTMESTMNVMKKIIKDRR